MARSFGILATIALALASVGCSFLFADGPPAQHEKMLYFDCTSTPGLEVADGSLALLNGLAGVNALTQTDAEYQKANGKNASRTGAAAVSFVGAGVFAASTIYGIIVTENCSDAKAELRQRIIEREQRRTAAPPAPPAAPALLPPALPAPAAPPAPAAAPAAPPDAPLPAPPPPSTPPAATPPPPVAPAPAPAPKPGTGSF